MTLKRKGFLTAAFLGAFWSLTISILVSVAMSFLTGAAFKPDLIYASLNGGAAGLLLLLCKGNSVPEVFLVLIFFTLGFLGTGALIIAQEVVISIKALAHSFYSIALIFPLANILKDLSPRKMDKFDFEKTLMRFLIGLGFIIFTITIFIPFYVMIMTSLKSQQELILNPLDFSIDFSKGLKLFRSYYELFKDFGFAKYLYTSFYISFLTVVITLAFSIPGAYAVARLRFKGRGAFNQFILLIYMVPMIVLALPIYIIFSITGLRNTLLGIVIIYPVTTIPVALYMLQGYFRGLPAEVEEAGLMDGLSRLSVIRHITLPLALPALVSVSLYVFMISWNEFLLAFMLLDDPTKFTLTRGIASLNSSEVPRQHLMAGAVISTIPIMILFLILERFMTKGLAAGSIKG